MGAVFLGWVVAVFAGLVESPLLRLLYFSFPEPAVGRGGEFTVTLVVISLVAGFLSYLIGGHVADRARR